MLCAAAGIVARPAANSSPKKIVRMPRLLRFAASSLGELRRTGERYRAADYDGGPAKLGAVEKTRTSTEFPPQRPQRCASTNSATTARRWPNRVGLRLANPR